MLSSEYNKSPIADTAGHTNNAVVLCEGYFVSEEERFRFISRNLEEASVSLLCKQASPLYGSVGFPFEGVETILSSTDRTDFLYVFFRSPIEIESLIYDEYVFKNYPTVVLLFKKMREGGDIIVFKKKNDDLLFVKIHNIYEGPELLHMCL
tara:strand:- start:462 stop:914 length:453 start_codon:yes stop_codon:yes gene_type:complete